MMLMSEVGALFFFRPWWLPAGKPLVEDFMKKLRDRNKNNLRIMIGCPEVWL